MTIEISRRKKRVEPVSAVQPVRKEVDRDERRTDAFNRLKEKRAALAEKGSEPTPWWHQDTENRNAVFDGQFPYHLPGRNLFPFFVNRRNLLKIRQAHEQAARRMLNDGLRE